MQPSRCSCAHAPQTILTFAAGDGSGQFAQVSVRQIIDETIQAELLAGCPGSRHNGRRGYMKQLAQHVELTQPGGRGAGTRFQQHSVGVQHHQCRCSVHNQCTTARWRGARHQVKWTAALPGSLERAWNTSRGHTALLLATTASVSAA